METNTATPAATAADTSDADILAIATAADEGREIPVAQPQTSDTPEKKNVTTDDTVESAKPKEDGKQEKKPEDDKTKKDAKPETDFAKAKKENERNDRSWKALDAEKNAFRQEKAAFTGELENLRREVAELKKKPAAPTGPVMDEHGFTAATYEAVAKKAKAENDPELAALAEQKAAALKHKEAAASAAPAASAEPWKSPEFQQQWAANAAAIVQAEPELGNPENPVFKSVEQLVNKSDFATLLKSRPEGIRAAVEVAKLQITAAEVPTLRKEVETLKTEIARLNKLTQPRGSLPASQQPGQKRIEEMSPDEADTHVRNLAAAADRGEV